LRQRTYSRVVLWILLGLIALSVVLIGFSSLNEVRTPAANMAPQECSAQVTTYCTTQHYSQAQIAQLKEADLQHNASSLGFPGSLTFAMRIFSYSLVAMLGLLLLAPMMGTEYTLGTIRLLFTRGPTRLQCIVAKALAGLIYSAGVVVALTLTYIIVGMLVYPMAGLPYSYTFGRFHDASFGVVFSNSLWLLVISIVYWYAFSVLALFFGTLGRSTAAALGCAFAWFFLEEILPLLIGYLMSIFSSGPVHDLLKVIPDYLFLGNLNALVGNRLHAIAGQNVSWSSDLHSMIVVAVYFVLLIGASCLITMRRDVTN
jgi:ABC-type transport system involved in multi-copper enzyme maturation permease subunit